MRKKGKNSIREISKAVNVSIGTVPRVLDNKPDVNPETRERISGYLQEYQSKLWNEEGGSEGMRRLLSRKNLSAAVILCSDFLDIAVYLDPPLTTHRRPLREMGKMAAARLGQIIREKGTAMAEKKYLRCPLIVRKSVKS